MYLETLKSIAIILGCILITTGIGYGGTKLFDLIKSKIKNEPIKKLIEKIESIFKTAIKTAYQVEVETLKKQGQFDDFKKERVKENVFLEIVSKLSDEEKDLIIKEYGDLKKYVDDHIEEVIYDLKNNKE